MAHTIAGPESDRNLWSEMKHKAAAQEFRGIQELVDVLKKLWTTEIAAEMRKNLVTSMPRRVAAVIRNKGYPSKYLIIYSLV